MARRSAATAALVTLALGSPAWPQGFVLAGPPDQVVEIEADQMTYAWETQVLKLEGHVKATRGEGVVRAAKGTLDRAHGLLSLDGGVLGVQGKDVLLADSALIDLNAKTADLEKATLYLKEKPANPDAPKAGRNSLILHGKRIRQLDEGYIAEDVTLTPCDCAGEPDYELLADTARIDGDRAHLSGAHLRFLGATLPLFPLALPLQNRQWGLLAPEFGFGGSYWFTFAQPVFIPLGPSYDLTVTPGLYTGGTMHGAHDPGGAVFQEANTRSIKGPRLGLEFRYAPVEGTLGSLKLDLYDDLDASDSPLQHAVLPGGRDIAAGRGYGGVRAVAHVAHRTESGGGVFAVDGAAATDVMATRDPAPFALESLQDTLRTDVGAWRSNGAWTAGAAATLLQDIRIANGLYPDQRLFGAEARSTFQRLPGAFVQLAPVPFGPAAFSFEASAAQFERLFTRADPLEEATGFGLTDRGASASLPAPGNLGRAPALRLDLAPRLSIAGPADVPFDLRAEAGARVDGWLMEGSPDRDRSRAYVLAGASAGLPLERKYGSLLHRIEPQLSLRALSRPLSHGGPPIGDLTDAGGATYASAPDASHQGLAAGVPAARRAYDEIDFAAPESGAVEATASLSQALWAKSGRTASRVFQLDFLQDALLWDHGGKARLGEASVVAGGQAGPASFGAQVRYDWALKDLSAFSAGASAHDARTDEVHGAVTLLNGSSSERLRAGIDELFSAARLDTPPATLSGSAGAGGSIPLPKPGLRLAYDFSWVPGDTPANFANMSHRAMLTYETPCKCAGLLVIVSYPFHDAQYLYDHWWHPDFSVRIDLKSLGSFGTF